MRNDLIKAEKAGRLIVEANTEYDLLTGEVMDLIERSGGQLHALVAAYYIGIALGGQILAADKNRKQEVSE